ncbi:aminotransferase class IV [Clostridium sp. D2Q-11]|uniref:Aminotransferase class IV n=1 Tax=Anaeromonas frigoriresistens TaxID=2683708 RepID=A0A942UY11_9FIRM|nr:aminotransferase class IV [Anaeromonas frigoriresistens]MBS4539066.1 aminotransferase class IV [Anaeromonas frigoriresistens]
MNIESNGKYIIYNGYIKESIDNIYLNEGQKIYEVIRVIDGVPLFLEDHIERLKKSCELIGYKCKIEEKNIINNIIKLIKENKIHNMNIKIILNYYEGGFDSVFYFIESFYPEKTFYENGVKAITIDAVRDNPQVKKVNEDFRSNIKRKLKEKEAFEALLINEEGYITEGSRSNIFFIKENTIYTAPRGEVLLGITRDKILSICRQLDIEVKEDHLKKDQLSEVEGIIMSGTSVGVLPISKVNESFYNSSENIVVKRIKATYTNEVEGYIKNNKNFQKSSCNN